MRSVIRKVRRNYYDFKRKRFYSDLIKHGDLCFDIGANIGDKSKILLSLGATVIAFEPQSSCFPYLESIPDNKFRYLPFAVGSKNEVKELQLANHIEVATFSDEFIDYFKNEQLQWSESEKVTVKSLNFLIQEFGLPSFCKVDVEGYESEVLCNLEHKIPLIEFEFTGGFIGQTLKIIEYLDSENTEYNFILNENTKFELVDWVDSREITHLVGKLPVHRLHGNIFIRTTSIHA